MANNFAKQMTTLFEEVVPGFEDAMTFIDTVRQYNIPGQTAERSRDTLYITKPYIAISNSDGWDQTSNFGNTGKTQLLVPIRINNIRTVVQDFEFLEMRDEQQQRWMAEAAIKELGSQINRMILDAIAMQGSIVVARQNSASGPDDLSTIDAVMNSLGIPMGENRKIALNSWDYNKMAENLSKRDLLGKLPEDAYKRGLVSRDLFGFYAMKSDYTQNVNAAGGGSITIDTRTTAGNYWVPVGSVSSAIDELQQVDSRRQVVTVSSTAGVSAGDMFSIDGVESVHMITKQTFAKEQTFRVVSVNSGTTMTISPPIISNQGNTTSEAEYQNVIVTPAANASIIWLNTAKGRANPFWSQDSVFLVPGQLPVGMELNQAGLVRMGAKTVNGVPIVMTAQSDILTQKLKIRWDIYLGVNNVCPEQNGVIIFNQGQDSPIDA